MEPPAEVEVLLYLRCGLDAKTGPLLWLKKFNVLRGLWTLSSGGGFLLGWRVSLRRVLWTMSLGFLQRGNFNLLKTFRRFIWAPRKSIGGFSSG